jgi:hypothetical protein
VRRTLRRLARQRVVTVLQPYNVPIVERGVPDDEETEAALLTCYRRGWVEPMGDPLPTGTTLDFLERGDAPLTKMVQHYRLTDSGWSEINKRDRIAVLTLVITAVGVVVAVLALAAD